MPTSEPLSEQQLRHCATHIRNFQDASIEQCGFKKENRKIEAALRVFDKELAALKVKHNELLLDIGTIAPDRANFERGVEPNNASSLRKFGLLRIMLLMLFTTYVSSYIGAQRELNKKIDRVRAQIKNKEMRIERCEKQFAANKRWIGEKERIMRVSAQDHAKLGCPNRLNMIVTDCK